MTKKEELIQTIEYIEGEIVTLEKAKSIIKDLGLESKEAIRTIKIAIGTCKRFIKDFELEISQIKEGV